jgi:hypothetical protein
MFPEEGLDHPYDAVKAKKYARRSAKNLLNFSKNNSVMDNFISPNSFISEPSQNRKLEKEE